MTPLISIVIPAYEMQGRGVEMLRELLVSIELQTFKDYEVVVSDVQCVIDGSELCFPDFPFSESLQVKFVGGKQGAAANLNNAISHASSTIIKPMFQDDKFMEADSLQKIVETFNDDAVQWIACISENVGLDNYTHLPYAPSSIEALRTGENTYGCPSAMAWRANDLRMDENLKFLFDCEFYSRMQMRYGLPTYVKTPIYIRAWEGQATRTVCDGATRIADTNEVIEKYRDREEGNVIKQVELEKIKFAFAQQLSPHLMDVATEFREDFLTENVVMMVTGFIWGERGAKREIRYPVDWAQSFKLRWFPRWALKRWPVAYTVHDLTPMTLYPEFRISVPSETHVLKLDMHERSEINYIQ